MALKDWEREAERYELYAAIPGKFTHRVKPGMEHGEPLHYLCTNCFNDKKKSVLQFSVGAHIASADCPHCKHQLHISPENISLYFPNLPRE